jgi:hypothetical protein
VRQDRAQQEGSEQSVDADRFGRDRREQQSDEHHCERGVRERTWQPWTCATSGRISGDSEPTHHHCDVAEHERQSASRAVDARARDARHE